MLAGGAGNGRVVRARRDAIVPGESEHVISCDVRGAAGARARGGGER